MRYSNLNTVRTLKYYIQYSIIRFIYPSKTPSKATSYLSVDCTSYLSVDCTSYLSRSNTHSHTLTHTDSHIRLETLRYEYILSKKPRKTRAAR